MPPDDWQPDPAWPAPPAGWQFWVDDAPPALKHVAAPESATSPAQDHVPYPPHPPVGVQSASHAGLFGKKKRLEAENAELREWLTYLGGLQPMRQAALAQQLRTELEGLQQQIAAANAQLADVRAGLVRTEEVALLQEAGIHQSALAKLRANGEDTTELEAKLAEIGEEISSVEPAKPTSAPATCM